MRKVILSLAVSLDGYIEGPNGEYDWCFTDQDYGLSEFLQRVDTLFMGRKSFEVYMKEGDSFPQLKKYIFSNTLETVPPDATVVQGDIKKEVEAIKNKSGKDIWLYGGASLTTSFINLGLVDEMWLTVHPILLGKGTPLFNHIQNRTHLQLLDAKTYSTGLVSLTYTFKQ